MNKIILSIIGLISMMPIVISAQTGASESPSQSLITQFLPEVLWGFTDLIEREDIWKKISKVLLIIRNVAIPIGFLLFVIQSGIEMFKRGDWVGRIAVRFLMMIIVLTIISNTHTYKALMFLIAKPAEIMAQSLTAVYLEDYMEGLQDIFSVYGESKKVPYTFLKQLVSGALFVQVLATIFFLITSVLVLLIPLVQQYLFIYVFTIGPMMLVFSFCDWTKAYAQNWFNLTMAVCWLSFFGSVSLMIFTISGTMNKIATTASWNDVLPTIVYGVLSTIVLISSYKFATFIMNATGSGTEHIGRTAIGVGGGAITGAAAASSIGVNKAGTVADALNNFGSNMVTNGSNRMSGNAASKAFGTFQQGMGRAMQGTGGVMDKVANSIVAQKIASMGDSISSKGEKYGTISSQLSQSATSNQQRRSQTPGKRTGYKQGDE